MPDESEHFYKSFALSEGRLIARRTSGRSGDLLPRSLPRVVDGLMGGVPFHADRKVSVAAIRAAFAERVRPEDRGFVGLMVSAYSSWVYLPQALGIALARLCSDSVLVLAYAGRFANVLACSILFCLAIRATPLARPLFFLLPLTPMAVFQMGSLSADALTNSFCFFFVAAVLRHAVRPRNAPARAEVVRLCGLSLLLGLTKPGFVWLPALSLLAPPAEGFPRRRRLGLAILLLACSVGAMLAWSLAVRSVYPPLAGGPASESLRQLRGMAAHPAEFLAMAASYYVRRAPSLANQYIGKLGWVDTTLPPALVVAIAFGLVAVASTNGCDGPALSGRQRLITAAVLFGSIAWVTALLYVIVTPYGARTIEGTQGRHFIPLGPLAFLLLYNRRWCVDWGGRRAILIGWAALTLSIALGALIRRFYV